MIKSKGNSGGLKKGSVKKTGDKFARIEMLGQDAEVCGLRTVSEESATIS